MRPKKQVSAADRTRALRCGCSSASSRVSHSTAAGRGEDAAAAGDHGGHADLQQRLRGRRPGRRAGSRSPRCRGAAARPRLERRTRREQRRTSRARSSAIRGRTCLTVSARCTRLPRSLAAHDPDPERRRPAAHRPAGCRRGGPRRRAYDDPRVAELGARRAAPGTRRAAAASLRQLTDERLPGGRGLGGGEVGDDVAAAEGVDGLLGVADQHHRGVAAEGAVEHLPLHRVGVLELVDQHDLPALPHPRPAGGAVGDLSASASWD